MVTPEAPERAPTVRNPDGGLETRRKGDVGCGGRRGQPVALPGEDRRWCHADGVPVCCAG